MKDINLNDLEIDESNSCGLLSFSNNNDLYTFHFYSKNGVDTFFDLSKNSNKVIQKHKCKDRIEISCCEIDGTFYFVDTKGKNDLEFSKSLLGSRYRLYFVPSNELPYYNSSETQNPPPSNGKKSSGYNYDSGSGCCVFMFIFAGILGCSFLFWLTW